MSTEGENVGAEGAEAGVVGALQQAAEDAADANVGGTDQAAAAVAQDQAQHAEAPDQGAPVNDEAADISSGATVETMAVTTSSGPIHIRYFGAMNVGLIREHNEDNFTVADLDGRVRDLPDGGVVTAEVKQGGHGVLLAVCDGMGGAAAGEVASQMAVDTIYEVMQSGPPPKDRDVFARRLVFAVEDAGGRIFGAAKMDRSRRGMGTTATAAGFIDRVLFVGQVGDSRAYVLRNGELGLITKDQSLVNQLIEAGQLTEEEAEAFEHSNIILQALGTTEEVAVDLTFLELRAGDRLMMCSDGLSGMVHPEIIREVLAETADIPAACNRLIEMANAGGGHDNITCVIADFDGPGLDPSDNAPPPVYQQYPLPPGDDEDPVTTPRQSPQMKSGSHKPGADVKRSPFEYEDPTPTVPAPKLPWALIILGGLLLGALVLFGLFVAFMGPSSSDALPPPPAPAPAPLTPGPTEARPVGRVTVSVSTDVEDGHLYVDGDDYGPISRGNSVRLDLPPGPHRLEVHVGLDVAVSAPIQLRPGVPQDIELATSDGSTDDGDAEDDIAPAIIE